MRGNRLTATGRVHPFVRLTLDADLRRVYADRRRQYVTHAPHEGSDRRALRHNHNINIHHIETTTSYEVDNSLEELETRGALPAWIGVRKVLADVSGRRRTQYGVGKRVAHRVSV